MKKMGFVISFLAVCLVLLMVLTLGPGAYTRAQATVLNWAEGTPEVVPRYNGSAAMIGNTIYTIGGLDAPPPNGRQVEIYGVGSAMWSLKSALPDPQGRYGAGAVSYNNKIFLFGGSGVMDNTTNTVDTYITQTDTWITKVASYPVPTIGTTPIEYKGKIYLFGGCSMAPQGTPESYYNYVYEFNPETYTFTAKTPMPTPRNYTAVTIVGEQILVSGGVSNPPTTANEIFNPVTNSWMSLAALPMSREGAVGAALDGKVYLMGGRATNKVFEYDPAKNSWSESTPLLYARDYPFVTSYNGKIYVMGGRGTGGLPVQKMEIGSMILPTPPTPGGPTPVPTALPTAVPTAAPQAGTVAVSEAMKSIAGKYNIVWGYDAAKQEWKIYDPTAPDMVNDLKLLEKSKGYFINVKENCTIVYKSDTYQLTQGWNLIGFLG